MLCEDNTSTWRIARTATKSGPHTLSLLKMKTVIHNRFRINDGLFDWQPGWGDKMYESSVELDRDGRLLTSDDRWEYVAREKYMWKCLQRIDITLWNVSFYRSGPVTQFLKSTSPRTKFSVHWTSRLRDWYGQIRLAFRAWIKCIHWCTQGSEHTITALLFRM